MLITTKMSTCPSFYLKKKAKIGEWGIGEIGIATRRKSVYIIFKVENLITN